MTSNSPSPLLRLLLAISTGIVGIAVGGGLGVLVARDSEALVGGAIVAVSAIAGGVAGLLLGALAAWKLPAERLPRATGLLGVPALLLLALGVRGLWQIDQQTRDPEEAYAGIPVFVALLERDPAGDPYLAPRVEVNAKTREWTTMLPDGRRCRGRLRAAVQLRVSSAIPREPLPGACRDEAPRADLERVEWSVEDGGSGAALLDRACLGASPSLAQLAGLLSMASSLAESKVSCD